MAKETNMTLAGSSVLEDARAFLDREWETVLADLERLVRIDSSEDLESACEGAPFGAGPRAALDEAFAMVRGYGFEPHDCEGYCGYFQIDGTGTKQLGIIGHLDVVPAGDGWTYDPFSLTREDGNLVGRGTTDDKGPLICAFHALRFWRDRFEQAGKQLPVDVRVIFGCSEETGMADADYYIERYGAPDFLFTPDADFPLCYGEKGQLQIRVTSAPVQGGRIRELQAGTAMNGVPGTAFAVVEGDCTSFAAAEHVRFLPGPQPGTTRIEAQGVAGHAAMPEGSLNALGVLVRYLLDQLDCTSAERDWLGFVDDAASAYDGSGLGIACSDDDFGPLTCVASVARLEDARFTQCIDMRFPTTASLAGLARVLRNRVETIGASLEVVNGVEPLLVNPQSPHIEALRSSYEEVTGCEARLFTMGGGTYAHHFPVAVSFGAMDEARFPKPEHLGGMHAADEGVAEECLRQALLIYIVALGKLFALDWS